VGRAFLALSLAALWLVAAGTFEAAELVTAAAMALAGTWISCALERALPARIRAPARWLVRIPSAFGTILVETARVMYGVLRLLATGRQPRSTLHVIELPATPRDASDEAWSAWLTGAMSIAPNGIVIDVDPVRRRMLLSQFVREKPQRARRRAEKLA
jgi:multisubunit Na+/H+ antiporter MnhE subunit